MPRDMGQLVLYKQVLGSRGNKHHHPQRFTVQAARLMPEPNHSSGLQPLLGNYLYRALWRFLPFQN